LCLITDFWQKQGCWDQDSEIANFARAEVREQSLTVVSKTFTVPAGQYFLMGDNRRYNGSEDSRLFGSVPLDDIAGRATVSIWPLFRPLEAKIDCNYNGEKPEDHVAFSGPLEWNPRVLPRGF
jgi:signal peptidase I